MEHYYSEKQKSLLKLKKIKQKLKSQEFEFYTSTGVFSKEKIDKGTLVLAENMLIDKNSKVLDIGCGIGILGIVAAKLFNANVVMTDINKRAVMLAKMNTKLNNVKVEVYQGNLYKQIKQNDFDVILSNPPQTAGKEVCFRLIELSKEHLKSYRSEASGELKTDKSKAFVVQKIPKEFSRNQRFLSNGGNLQLVARHNIGGKALSKKMEEVFGNVKVIAKKGGYWVYLSVKK